MTWLDNKSAIDKILIIIGMIFLALILIGCDVLKKTTKTREDRTVKEQTETVTKREGDTVTYKIPNIKFKDTTIYTTNRVTGTTQVLRYNDKGQIDMAQCISGAIEEITRSNRELVEAINNKDRTVEKEFKTEIIIYIMLGLVLIVGVIVFFMYRLISKNTKLVNKLIP